MCRAIRWAHAQCNHTKTLEPLPFDRCTSYDPLNAEHLARGHCDDALNLVHTNLITAPMLCVPCFRRREENIRRATDVQIDKIVYEMMMLPRDLDRMEVPDREALVRHKSALEERLTDCDVRCKFAIASFRAQQGVWADG